MLVSVVVLTAIIPTAIAQHFFTPSATATDHNRLAESVHPAQATPG